MNRDSETARRITKAAKLARILDRTTSDARTATAAEWNAVTRWANVNTPSPATRAAVTAILDVRYARFTMKPTGDAAEQIAYNTARKASLVNLLFTDAGLANLAEAEEDHWSIACQLATRLVGAPVSSVASESLRDAVAALRAA